MSESNETEASTSVLIVDDAPAVRRTLQRTLVDLGIPQESIREAETGREGLEIFRQERPDLVLLDIVLDGIQGDDVGEVMLAERPETKVVPITALRPGDERVRFLVSKGAAGAIEKPVDPAQIQGILTEGENSSRSESNSQHQTER